ncbi:hypothetical protein IPJ72_05270 [Candidatus Peregrinibacteria bacterium]|nr:MAG: hypothetical protein IPJ72_05270 [Candidatus Peregrinibacteria bacterium]
MSIKSNSKGFSLAEILLTASIFIILASVGVGAYFQYYRASLGNIDINSTLTLLKRARSLALKNATNANYGVHIDPINHQFTIFQNMYTSGGSGNITLDLKYFDILDFELNPQPGITNEIVFENRTARTQNDGTITIGNQNTNFTFNVNTFGVIE